jgi:hypothetical protein
MKIEQYINNGIDVEHERAVFTNTGRKKNTVKGIIRITSAGRVGGVLHDTRNSKARYTSDVLLLTLSIFKIKIVLTRSSYWRGVYVSVCLYKP